MSAEAEHAVRMFGTTTDPWRAGWVLPDGRMLDFYKEVEPGREVHARISEVFEGLVPTDARDAFRAQGNARFKLTRRPNREPMLVVESDGPLTVAQQRAVMRAFPRDGGDYLLDIGAFKAQGTAFTKGELRRQLDSANEKEACRREKITQAYSLTR